MTFDNNPPTGRDELATQVREQMAETGKDADTIIDALDADPVSKRALRSAFEATE